MLSIAANQDQKPEARFTGFTPVHGIAPVDGWTLLWDWYADGDGFWTPCFIARSAERDEMLHVSRFRFQPSQQRFAWLVRNAFPRSDRGGWTGNWTGEEIDIRIVNDRLFGECAA